MIQPGNGYRAAAPFAYALALLKPGNAEKMGGPPARYATAKLFGFAYRPDLKMTAPPAALPVLPAAWVAWPLPMGYIAPSLAQLALLRGEVFAYDAATGRGLVGGRVLVGTAGGIFDFIDAATADEWRRANAQRGANELSTMAALPAASYATAKADKAAVLAARVPRLNLNAAAQSDPVIGAALHAEAAWYGGKWA